MEGIHSPIIIRNLKNKTTKVMYLDLHKIFKKIVIKQKPLILSNNSFKNISNYKTLSLTQRKKKETITRDTTNLIRHNPLTNSEIRNKLLGISNENKKSKKNNYINLNKLRKNISNGNFLNDYSHKGINFIEESKFYKVNDNKIFNEKQKNIYKNLRKIFSLNILPNNDKNKYKFVRPKSYIKLNWWDNDNKKNKNENKLISRSFLLSKCSKDHLSNSLNKFKKLKNEIFLRNSEENRIYKTIVKNRLYKSVSAFKRINKLSNNKIHFGYINKI